MKEKPTEIKASYYATAEKFEPLVDNLQSRLGSMAAASLLFGYGIDLLRNSLGDEYLHRYLRALASDLQADAQPRH